MKIPNPDNPVFVQRNQGERDAFSNVAGTFNCDFTKYPGKVCPSARLIQGTNTTDEAALEQCSNFVAWDGVYWTSSEDNTYIGNATGAFDLDDNTYAPGGGGNQDADTENSDVVVYDGAVIVSLSTRIYRRDDYTNNWTKDWFSGLSGGAALTSGNPHPMEPLLFTNVLAIGDGNIIRTVQKPSGSYTATATKLTLSASHYIKWIRSGLSRAYIGCTYAGNGDGFGLVYEWDGGDVLPTRVYKLDSFGAFTATTVGDTLYILTTNGELQVLEGGGFRTVGALPIVGKYKNLDNWDGDFNPVNVGQRGMVAKDGKILINISSKIDASSVSAGSYFPYFPSGVWEYDPQTGRFSHKFSATMDKTGSVDMGQWCSPALADSCPGGIQATKDNRSYSILLQHGYYTDASATNKSAIYVDDQFGTTKRRARIWTNEVFAPEDTTQWEVALKYQKMKNADDKIVVKYRTHRSAAYPLKGAVTWTSSTVFTTTSTDFANAAVGDEVFVTVGHGGGCSAHIASISLATSTYTVTLDEAIYGITASDAGIVAVEDFKKLASFNDRAQTQRTITIPSPTSPSCQVLIELHSDGGDSPILDEIDVRPV
jgi:hypothetical protein